MCDKHENQRSLLNKEDKGLLSPFPLMNLCMQTNCILHMNTTTVIQGQVKKHVRRVEDKCQYKQKHHPAHE